MIKSKIISGIIVSLFLINSCTVKPTPPLLITAEPTSISQTTATSGGILLQTEVKKL